LSTYKKIAAYSKHCKLKWKPDISEEVRDLIQGMLHPKPPQRLGNTSGGIDELKGHRWFESLDWDKLYKKEVRYCVQMQAASHTAYIAVQWQLQRRRATTSH
jgi:serine/threonine protein kinase